MREGYILIHRQMFKDAWVNPKRTLAWIDMISMADYENHCVTASVRFLAKRWGINKSTVHRWIREWVDERSLQQEMGHIAGQDVSSFIIVNYAKYQQPTKVKAGQDEGQQAGQQAGQIETTPTRSIETNVPFPTASPSEESVEQSQPTTSVSDRTKDIQKHLQPYALFCFLFDLRFQTIEQRDLLFKRNVGISKTLSTISVEILAGAMILAEDYWFKEKKRFPIRMETVHKFVEDLARDGLNDELKARARALVVEFNAKGKTVFDIQPALAHV